MGGWRESQQPRSSRRSRSNSTAAAPAWSPCRWAVAALAGTRPCRPNWVTPRSRPPPSAKLLPSVQCPALPPGTATAEVRQPRRAGRDGNTPTCSTSGDDPQLHPEVRHARPASPRPTALWMRPCLKEFALGTGSAGAGQRRLTVRRCRYVGETPQRRYDVYVYGSAAAFARLTSPRPQGHAGCNLPGTRAGTEGDRRSAHFDRVDAAVARRPQRCDPGHLRPPQDTLLLRASTRGSDGRRCQTTDASGRRLKGHGRHSDALHGSQDAVGGLVRIPVGTMQGMRSE